MKVVVTAQQKGGVGKSTIAIHIAAEAMRNGLKTMILELDRQGTASIWSDNRIDSGEDAQEKVPPNVMKIESSQLERVLTAMRGLSLDLVVIDMPGTHSTAVNAAIKSSDFVLIPARPHEADIGPSGETLGAVIRLNKPYAYVLTFVDGASGAKRAKEVTEILEEEGHPVCPTYIGRRNVYADSIADGKTVMEVDQKSKASTEVGKLWNWLSKELEKDMSDEQRTKEASRQPSETRH